MLDQGQTITVNAVARTYNLITYDNLKTIRDAILANGGKSRLTIDHTEGANVAFPGKAKVRGNFHKVQLASELTGPNSTLVPVVITYSVAIGEGASASDVEDEADGFRAFIPGVQARVHALES